MQRQNREMNAATMRKKTAFWRGGNDTDV